MQAIQRCSLLALVLALSLAAQANARSFVVHCLDGGPCDADGACDGACTFRQSDLCAGLCGECSLPPYCSPWPHLLVRVSRPASLHRRKVARLKVDVNQQPFVFKCRAARDSCARPMVADELIGNWLVDAPIATTSDCRAGMPLYFEREFSISQSYEGSDHFVINSTTWGYQPFVAGASFVLRPYGHSEYDARFGRAPLCDELPPPKYTAVDITVTGTRPDAMGRIMLQEVVTYSDLGSRCPPCTMTGPVLPNHYSP
jgi:hypothetical protein